MTAWYGPQSSLFGKKVTVVFGNGVPALTGTVRRTRAQLELELELPNTALPGTPSDVAILNPDNIAYIRVPLGERRNRPNGGEDTWA